MGPGVGVVYAVDEGVKGAGGAQVGGKLDRVVVERRVDELPSGGGGLAKPFWASSKPVERGSKRAGRMLDRGSLVPAPAG